MHGALAGARVTAEPLAFDDQARAEAEDVVANQALAQASKLDPVVAMKL